ncbi:MAG TPA: pyruvate, water dikinase regulatory protein [Bacteroidales bacterium]|nr:pyruvate, water dikinase regulatory protein [Bacteroidales bacterium]
MAVIFVISDGTGRTASQALSAALMQFPAQQVSIEVYKEIRTRQRIRDLVKEAAAKEAFIVHTLVSNQLREFMITCSRDFNVETIDLMGPLLARLSDVLISSPSEKPGLFSEINKEYFKRIDAVQFAFQHDDGQRPEGLHKAEIVLVGVSRTFKTPLSIYLAFRGWLVANVPIVLGIDPPEELLSLPAERVIGLMNNPHNLAKLRHSRQERFGLGMMDYSTPVFVERELNYAENIFRQHPGWRVVRVTNKPIEEIASEILALIGHQQDEDS